MQTLRGTTNAGRRNAETSPAVQAAITKTGVTITTATICAGGGSVLGVLLAPYTPLITAGACAVGGVYAGRKVYTYVKDYTVKRKDSK